jgi:hypothetical protein
MIIRIRHSKEEPSLEEGSGLASNSEPRPGQKYAEAFKLYSHRESSETKDIGKRRLACAPMVSSGLPVCFM